MIFLNNFFKVILLIFTAFLFFGCEDKNENDENELSFPGRPVIHLTARELEPYNPVTEIKLSFIGDCTLATQLGDNYMGSFNWYAENYDKEYFLKKFIRIPAMMILQLPTVKMFLLIMHSLRHIRGIILLSGFGHRAGMLKYFPPEMLRL